MASKKQVRGDMTEGLTIDLNKFASLSVAERVGEIDKLRDRIIFGEVKRKEAEPLSRSLVMVLSHDSDGEVLEQVFDALMNLTVEHNALDADWSKVAEGLGTLTENELEFALVILGNSNDSRYLREVKAYVNHSDKQVREAAITASSQLAAADLGR